MKLYKVFNADLDELLGVESDRWFATRQDAMDHAYALDAAYEEAAGSLGVELIEKNGTVIEYAGELTPGNVVDILNDRHARWWGTSAKVL